MFKHHQTSESVPRYIFISISLKILHGKTLTFRLCFPSDINQRARRWFICPGVFRLISPIFISCYWQHFHSKTTTWRKKVSAFWWARNSSTVAMVIWLAPRRHRWLYLIVFLLVLEHFGRFNYSCNWRPSIWQLTEKVQVSLNNKLCQLLCHPICPLPPLVIDKEICRGVGSDLEYSKSSLISTVIQIFLNHSKEIKAMSKKGATTRNSVIWMWFVEGKTSLAHFSIRMASCFDGGQLKGFLLGFLQLVTLHTHTTLIDFVY